jgi:hypothetical protein
MPPHDCANVVSSVASEIAPSKCGRPAAPNNNVFCFFKLQWMPGIQTLFSFQVIQFMGNKRFRVSTVFSTDVRPSRVIQQLT